MIKIGTKNELFRISHLPIHIQNAISQDVALLDENYGEDRNVDVDMGGFVVVCEKNESLHIENFNKNLDTSEFAQVICPYKKYLYIAGTERNIIVYEKM